MLVCKEIPEELKKRETNWEQEQRAFLSRAKLHYEYFMTNVDNTGTMFTLSQLNNIEGNTNIPVSVNRLYPLISKKISIMVQSKPSFGVITPSETDDAKKYAHIIDKTTHSFLRKSKSVSKIESFVRDTVVAGLGHIGIDDDDIILPGDFGFSLQYYPYEWVLLDSSSISREGEDIRGYFIRREIPLDVAEFKFNDLIEEINSYYSSIDENFKPITVESLSGTAIKGSRVDRVTLTRSEKTVYWKRYYSMGFTTMYVVKDLNGEISYRFKENYFPEQLPEAINKENVIDAIPNMYVFRTDMLGDKVISEMFRPLTIFPIYTAYYEWGGKPYLSKGMVHFEIGKQEAIDKSIQTMILNGMLQNNAGWTAPEGSLSPAQKEEWKKAGADPRAVKMFTPYLMGNTVLKPERDTVSPLSDFYPQLIMMLSQDMEFSTGIDPNVWGEGAGQKIEVFSTLQQYQNSAMQRIQMSIDHINHAMEYLGDLTIQYLLANIVPETRYTYLDENKNVNEIVIHKDAIEDFKRTKYLIQGTPTEAHPTQKNAMATELFKIAQTTPDPNERNVYIKKAFSLLDMRGFDELSDELDEVKKLTSTIQQMQQQIERDAELMKQMENKALNADYRAKLAAKLMQEFAKLSEASADIQNKMVIDALKEQIKELTNPKEDK